MITVDMPYLKNAEFLKQVDELSIREVSVNLILLDWNEQPIKEIQGKSMGGSINIDGNSAMRRTASIQMIVEDNENMNYNDLSSDYALNKKVNLLIGIKNTLNDYKEYPILWFPFGIFVISEISIQHSAQGTNISLSLKDKMCLLNGECGGTLPASVSFHEYEEYDIEHGTTEIKKVLIYNIIKELVNHYGGESISRIIIGDVPLQIKQVMRWGGEDPIYIAQFDGTSSHQQINYSLTPRANYKEYPSGSDIGYRYTDFVYPGELIGDAGATVCDILDQIKNLLGNFEYFYDVDGNFIFREIKNYLNTTQATVDLQNINSGDYLVDMKKGKSVYSFTNSNLITSYSNSPRLGNIKNDFIVWGIRKTISGMELPIRYHLAIDKKPETGTTKRNIAILKDGNGDTKYLIADDEIPVSEDVTIIKDYVTSDWRTELLFQGAEAEKAGTAVSNYYLELMNEWGKIYDIKYEGTKDVSGFKKISNSTYDYFLDFIDTSAALGDYSVSKIGCRSKVVVDNTINCLFEPVIPNICITEIGQQDDPARDFCNKLGEPWCQVPQEIFANMHLGGTYNGAYTLIKDLLYQYTNYNESISLQCLPIYYLEPNSRITVIDNKSGISGDYVIQTISIPLDINGTMSISANRALTKI